MASSSLARLAHVTDALLPQPADAAEEAAPATVDERIMIPTRDEGVRLSCLLSKPTTGGAGPWPCLLTMHYGGDHPAQGRADMALAGFVVADVVFRGCYHSEGMADGGIYVTLANDGFDVCEWLAAQEWCDGQVGSFGGSQGGFAQNL
jgi:predicted acyl esterase